MSESPSGTRASSDGDFDLTRFHQAFFEEAGENLTRMEALLLELDVDRPDDEQLDAIFRCAHSIKGGGATFGFQDVVDLAHVMEALLDRLRRHELPVSRTTVDVLLESGDALRALLARHHGTSDLQIDASELVERIRRQARARAADPEGIPSGARHPDGSGAGDRRLEVLIGPLTRGCVAEDIVSMFSEIPGLGTIEPLDRGKPDDQARRRFLVETGSTDEELLDLFSFHVSRGQVSIAACASKGAAPQNPESSAHRRLEKAVVAPESSTLRVPVERVDQLLNLAGELVITQVMLAQTGSTLDPIAHRQVLGCIADLERNTRLLQEAVMAIRMIPMAVVFSRFPRMLRELAGRLGKQVELHTVGEATELDKGMIEQITDPLTHLVRNALDHGIEHPHERSAAGKPAAGSITLSAEHRDGAIAIEVRDDGRGLNRESIYRMAESRGLPVRPAMTDREVFQLLFEPGFSTVEEVTEVSGRGVGLDVVRRNVLGLGGTVEIDAEEGRGMRVSARLPLTLAIMDGMSVAVGDETYIIPLDSVIESIRLDEKRVHSVVGANRLLEVGKEFLPVVALDELFSVPRFEARREDPITVVLEAEGGRIALLVDELVGQHQVVVKNLEANYRKVPGVSGATILGDGRVALILDVAQLVRRARH
jgi:two-component system chemotaxis sensor kinase CheA